MASTSSSSIQKSFKYDVFISFRGEDTRKNFVDHLYYALKQKGVVTYMDDENIEKGKRINEQLIKSIEDSRCYIIVFSKNYASSSWCLDELVKIMECQKMIEHTAYPIFYDVEPTEIRKQSGAVGEAFARHEKEEAVGKWRDALKEAADLAGSELKNTLDGREANFIQKIVQEISLDLRSINFILDEKLIGMETRIKDVVSSLEINVDDVRMLGIKGMGGIGKTTLARAVFDQISFQFEGHSFVENVREVSISSSSGLKKLQKQVLSDILNDQGVTVSGVLDGKNKMKKTMCARKVLIVLDDVDDTKQLEALAGDPDWFKSGSRIIITTRDEQVLVAHQVSLIRNVNLLYDAEAICLFSRYAFGKEFPDQGYKELSEEVVEYAAGLPLTVTVLGSLLCGQDESVWKDAIKRLQTIPLKATMEKLELSFDGLEDDYKEIFLDVACILKGWHKNDAIRMLESYGFHAEVGLRVLEQKSLITISKSGRLWMHDHLEQMGRNIVRRSHPDEPQRHSRLWVKEEIEDILTNDLGTQATKCLYFRSPGFSDEIAIKGVAKMKDLRFIHIDLVKYYYSKSSVVQFNKVSEYLPSSLRYMSWAGFPFSSLPNTFQGKHLVGLEMDDSNIVQLWEDGEEKVLHKLRFLRINLSKLRTFDLRLAPNLEQLIIYECYDLVEFQMHAESIKLKHLELTHSKLKTLHLGNAPNLEELHIEGCRDLVELKMPDDSLKLEYLELTHSKLRKLHLGSTPNLETLILKGCNYLVELEMLSVCLKLEELYLGHSKLRTLDLRLTPNLKRLNLEYCYDLVEINAPVGYLKKLAFLDLSCCGSFNYFYFDKQFDSHEVGSLSELHLIAEPTDVCPLHTDNDSPKFQFKCYYKEDPLSSFGNLERLISMGLCACTNLESFSRSICSLRCIRKLTLEGSIPEVPKYLDKLEYLEELIFSSIEIKYLPDSICKLKHLKYFKIISCWLLEKLPEDIGRLESLRTLILTDCKLLQDIPNSICRMKCIKYFHLPGCILVEKLPRKIGLLRCLKELNLEGTGVARLPLSIYHLKGLRIIGSRRMFDSCGLGSKLRRTSVSINEIFCYI